MALLFVREAETQLEKVLVDLLDVAAAVVVTVDELLELLREVGTRGVELDEMLELRADGRLQADSSAPDGSGAPTP